MSLTNPYLARYCARSLHIRSRPLSRTSSLLTNHQRRAAPSRRWESTTASPPTSAKVSEIVEKISQLTLLETADLVSSLKTRLSIPDLPLFSSSAPAAATPAAAAAEPEEAAPAAAEKTLFTLTLKSFDAGAKPKIIKEVKSMLGLSLVDSKKFVESAPKTMREGVPKEEGLKIVEALKALGGVVTMD